MVYVLVCSADGHYIEQALMSIWSARYHNPDAQIILLVDDKTDRLLIGARGELLNYISAKQVISFENDQATAMYRSRWIKTSVRELIDGDILFIDCDTIICKSLKDVDAFDCEMGAVWESHLKVEDFCMSLKKSTADSAGRLGVDLDAEKVYFSSGVLYAKDTPQVRRFYARWHACWKDGVRAGLTIDQPSMARANRECGQLIQKIPDTYNCIVFTQNNFTRTAHILHISSYHNPSFLFTDNVLAVLKNEGLKDWLKESILHPCDSMLPFDYTLRYSTRKERKTWINNIARTAAVINHNLPKLLGDFPMGSSLKQLVTGLFRYRCYSLGASVWMAWRMRHVKTMVLKDNTCRK